MIRSIEDQCTGYLEKPGICRRDSTFTLVMDCMWGINELSMVELDYFNSPQELIFQK